MSSIISACIGNTISLVILSELMQENNIILDIILTEEYYYLYGDKIKIGMDWLFN